MTKNRWTVEKKLGVVLGVLGVIILGLAIGICISVLNNANNGSDTESEQHVLSYEDAQYKIFNYYDGIAILSDSTTEDEIQGYLAETAKYVDELYNSYEDLTSRTNILIANVWFLQNFNGHAEEAISIGKKIEDESLSPYQKYLLYDFMGNAYRSLGDEATASQYYDLSVNNKPDVTLEEDV